MKVVTIHAEICDVEDGRYSIVEILVALLPSLLSSFYGSLEVLYLFDIDKDMLNMSGHHA